MQQITKPGAGKDFKLVPSDGRQFVTAVQECQKLLQSLRAQTAGLVDYGTVGNDLPEAQALVSELMDKTIREAVPAFDTIDDMHTHLVNGANAAITRFQAQDQST